ncbi:hypothetical protein Pint_31533 [Pistacia integerrima]|uniref:Uncharacterized protein n=1 Tax=Pistacia integerrima TaxID=434235 RepID=A0ACC0XLG0_9ROSI|nr:hypothetical protein Pint_31533 [Pistacia integerrima]
MDSHSLDREDHQDFVICCQTYSNSKILYPIGLEHPRSLARDFESCVSTISPPRHLETESYSMKMTSI